MPIQDFKINTGRGVAGEMYGLAVTNSQRLTFNAEAAMDQYGLAVVQGSKANSIKVGQDGGRILGITMRENKLESNKRPGDGTILIPALQPLAVMLDGPVLVMAKTAITDAKVGVNSKGEFGGVGGEFTEVTNVRALEYPIAAGDVCAVMVNVFPVKA